MLGLKVLFTLGACGFLVALVDWRQVARLSARADATWLAVVVVMAFADRAFMAFKWIRLVRASDERFPQAELTRAYYVGCFWGKFLPASVGGDLIRVAWLAGRFGQGAFLLSSVMVERLLGAVALAVFAVVGLALLPTRIGWVEPTVAALTAGFLVLCLVLALFVFHRALHEFTVATVRRLIPFRSVGRWITKLSEALKRFGDRPEALRSFLALSLVEQLFPILGNYLVARAFGIELSLMWVVIGTPIVLAVSRIPISVQNFGIQEGIFVFVFSLAGLPPASSILLSIVQRVAGILSTVPGVAFMLPGGWEGARRLAARAGSNPSRPE